MSKAQRSDMKEIRGSLLRSEGGGVDEMSLGRGDLQKYKEYATRVMRGQLTSAPADNYQSQS
jgi:hypothetical protein